jgi:hypothetical protein
MTEMVDRTMRQIEEESKEERIKQGGLKKWIDTIL